MTNQVDAYVKTHLKNYKLNPKMARQIRNNLEYEYEDIDCGFYQEAKYEERVKEYKEYFLKQDYFSKYPKKRDYYSGSMSVENALQLCANGGFENGVGQYTFRRWAAPVSYGGYNVGTINNTNFINFTPNGINTQNVAATLVSPGLDPIVPITRTHNGNRAVRLNYFQANGANDTINVTTMSRTFICNEATFNYSFSVILENPSSHSKTEQPFFRARIYDQNNNMVRENLVYANSGDCFFTQYNNPPPGFSTVLYSGWVCDQMKTAQFIGQQITVEFTIGDCTFSAHAGEVYIDDICGSNCANPVSGSINLDPIQTIDCPTQPIQVCGSYTLPAQAVYDNISLNLAQNGGAFNQIVASPTTLNQTANGGTFCFTVPLSVFGPNPYGTFEFEAQGNFTRQCTIQGNNFPLDPIYDHSANDSGPDVSFIGCITANADAKTFSTCTTEAFSVLDNDLVFGQQATLNNVTISTPVPFNLYYSFNPSTGVVTFGNNIPPGTYTFSYEICNANVPQDCDQATVTIVITPPEIIANDDDFSNHAINGCDGGKTISALANDTYCGTNILFNLGITHQLLNDGGLTGVTMDGFGRIIVPANSTPGTYTLTYKICDGSTPPNCDTAQVTVIVAPGETPTFVFLTTICSGSVAPDLPTTSTNGITGIWSPAQIDNQQTGTYTFTPSVSCSVPIDVTVNVLQDCGLVLEWDAEVNCQEANSKNRYFDADIVDGPCLRFCESSTVTFSLSGDTQAIAHTEWSVTGGNIQYEDNTTCKIEWTAADFSFIDVTVTRADGEVKHLHVCIEKLPLPTANFNVISPTENITVCAESPIFFENLSTANGGNDELYYLWEFGDVNGSTSTEFEPSFTYNHPGNYTVVLHVSNGCSCSAVFKRDVKVTKPLGPISCIGVVCAGNLATYSIPENDGGCELKWEAEGGEITHISNDQLSVSVNWNKVDGDGFGYLSVWSDCAGCAATAKVPVVTTKSEIKGKDEICADQQATYALPQWPTTVFDWSIENNTTGASLIHNIQRNEIVVQAGTSGVIHLVCHYQNTLLGCGGTASLNITVNPEVNLKKPETVCKTVGETYIFQNEQGNPINSAIHYTITGPENFSLTGNGVSFTTAFPEAGTYNVAIDSPGYCVDGFLSIEVKDLPDMPDAIEGETTICPGVPFTYSTQVPGGATAHWEVQNGTILGSPVGNSISAQFDPGVSGPYEVSVYYKNGGCPSGTYAITVEPEIPDLTFTTASETVCGSSYATYTIADNTAETYTWSIDPSSAGSIEQGQNTNSITILWNQEPQDATVKVQARKCSIIYEAHANVTVTGSPDIEIQGDSEACAGHSVNFNITILSGQGNFTAVQWDFGDGDTETTSNASIDHTYEQPLTGSTTYTVIATVINPNGCIQSSTDTFEIEVSPTPVVTISPHSIDYCITENRTIAVNVQSGFSPTYTVQWYKNGQQISNTGYSIDVSGSGLGAGTYYAKVSNTFGCTEATAHVNVTDPDCNQEGDGEYCPPITIQYSAEVTGCQQVTLDITGASVATSELYFGGIGDLGGTVTSNGSSHIIVDDLEPGYYTVYANATFDHNGHECYGSKLVEFIIPYKAGVKYSATCGENGKYDVKVLDHSVYYPGPGVSNIQYRFNIDGGTWQTGIEVNGQYELDTQLAPGTYQLGVRISAGGYDACEAFTTLELPDLPSAAFTIDNPGCFGEAVHFTATDTGPGLTYKWIFDDATNLQQNPAKTFTPGSRQVKLTVTNAFGCSVSHQEQVTVPPLKLEGHLVASPDKVCEGGSITIDYQPEDGQIMPVHFVWYRNTETEVAYANTYGTPSLTVTEDGQYYVYVTGPNGCKKYDTDAKPVSFIPLPDAPKIDGDQLVCVGNDVVLSVPDIDGLHYKWERDNVPQPQWDGMVEITDQPTMPDNYTYSVTATVDGGDGVSCSGPAGQFTVNLVPPPVDPVLIMEVLSCDPYSVKVTVTNPQANQSYYWSNGDTGTETTIHHDGPLQVIARTNTCSASAQVDLPLDLEALAWIFPKGCYVRCKNRSKYNFGYVVGPFGNFKEWSWNKDGNVSQSGTGTVADFHGIGATHDYSLYLATEDCNLTIAAMDVSTVVCEKCTRLQYTVLEVRCLTDQGFEGYRIKIQINNMYGFPVSLNLTAPYNQGFFVNNSLSVPPGISTQTLYFESSGTFNGGTVDVLLEAMAQNLQCQGDLTLHLPHCAISPRPENKPGNLSTDGNRLLFMVPNPTKGHQTQAFYNTGDAFDTYSIVVRDLFGRRLLSQNVKPGHGKTPLDCTRLASGTYLVCLQHGKQILETTKLIVK